jgi:hypothetical protein
MEEMKVQVAMKGEIFHCANEVVIGLGPSRKADENGIAYLTKLTSAFLQTAQTDSPDYKARFHALVLNIDENPNGWACIAGLFESPWWQRCWVIQEIVRSTNATILFGTLPLNYNVIEQAAKFLTNIEEILRENVRISQSYQQWKNNEGWQGALRMATTKAEYRLDQRPRLPQLLWRFAKHKVTNPRDRVYSLLGLLPVENGDENENLQLLQPDYELPLGEFFMRVTAYILKSSNSLDILSYYSAYQKDYTTESDHSDPLLSASWAVDLRTFSAVQPLTLGVFNGLPSKAIFSAGGMNTVPTYDIDLETSTLQLTGRQCGYIMGVLLKRTFPVSTEYDNGDNYGRWWAVLSLVSKYGIEILIEFWGVTTFQKMQYVYGIDGVLEAFWRTLLADQWDVGRRLGTGIRNPLAVPPTTIDQRRALCADPTLVNHLQFLKGRTIVVRNDGYLGLGPQDAEEADMVIVAPGGAVPYLLSGRHHPAIYNKDGSLEPLQPLYWRFKGEWCVLILFSVNQLVNLT